MKILFIEILIGSGKSWILSYIKKKYKNDIISLNEPLEEWNLLDFFYEDPINYSFSIQLQILIKKYKQLINAINKNLN